MLKIKFLLGALALILSVAATSIHADVVIVQEDFSGGATALNGTSAETFAATGSGNWVANTSFFADGSFSTTGAVGNSSAYLSLGEVINGTKGTADGLFELTSTFRRTGGSWFQGIGFSSLNTPNTGTHFLGANNNTGSVIQRNNDLDVFYLGNNNGPPLSNVNAARTITIELDLTGHDGVSNFGTATYFADGVVAPIFTHNYAADTDFESLILSGPNNAGGTVSNLTLTQITAVPEPGSLALLGLGSLVMVARRRKS